MNENVRGQFELINRLIRELSAVYQSAAGESGISYNELWIWYALMVMGGEYSQQDICDIWHLPKQTVNSITANLSKKNFIFLETVPGTRNRKIIRLTEIGKKYGESVITPICRAEQRALEKMSDSERQACVLLLGKYTSLLKNEFAGE